MFGTSTPTMPKPKRNDEPVKVDAEVMRVARIVAAYRGMTLAEYISERLRPLVEADHTEEIQKLSDTTPCASTRKGKRTD